VRIGLASDQLGFEHKERLKARVTRQGHAAEDRSAEQAGEYRAITDQLASAIGRRRLERGVLICSRAIGASVLANKQRGARAALCHDLYSAQHGVQHENMNLLVMGACVVTPELACELVDVFLQGSYVSREQAFGTPPGASGRLSSTFATTSTNPSPSVSCPGSRL